MAFHVCCCVFVLIQWSRITLKRRRITWMFTHDAFNSKSMTTMTTTNKKQKLITSQCNDLIVSFHSHRTHWNHIFWDKTECQKLNNNKRMKIPFHKDMTKRQKAALNDLRKYLKIHRFESFTFCAIIVFCSEKVLFSSYFSSIKCHIGVLKIDQRITIEREAKMEKDWQRSRPLDLVNLKFGSTPYVHYHFCIPFTSFACFYCSRATHKFLSWKVCVCVCVISAISNLISGKVKLSRLGCSFELTKIPNAIAKAFFRFIFILHCVVV